MKHSKNEIVVIHRGGSVFFPHKITNCRLKSFVILAKWFQNSVFCFEGEQRQISLKRKANVNKTDGLAQRWDL